MAQEILMLIFYVLDMNFIHQTILKAYVFLLNLEKKSILKLKIPFYMY